MNKLVQSKNDHAFTTTFIVAEGVKLEHRAVMQLIKTHYEAVKELGETTFEMTLLKRKFKPVKYYELTEIQATFLITLMRNSEIVIKFKSALTKDFFKMRRMLDTQAMQQTNKQWIEARESGKLERRVETDVIKDFVDYASGQGSKNAKKYYMAISKMENKALFFVEQKYKNLRNILSLRDLAAVQTADTIVSKALQDGMDNYMDYKDIFKMAKERVELFAELRGKSPIDLLEHAKSI